MFNKVLKDTVTKQNELIILLKKQVEEYKTISEERRYVFIEKPSREDALNYYEEIDRLKDNYYFKYWLSSIYSSFLTMLERGQINLDQFRGAAKMFDEMNKGVEAAGLAVERLKSAKI